MTVQLNRSLNNLVNIASETRSYDETVKTTLPANRVPKQRSILNLLFTYFFCIPCIDSCTIVLYKYFAQSSFSQDKTLTKEEILERQELFVRSKATNFGETLKRPVDEL